MKDYGMMKATLALLEEVQETLLNKKERAEDEVEQREKEFNQYSTFIDDEGTRIWQHTDDDGLISDCGRWDYEYRQGQLKEATQYRDVINNLIKYLDGYKL